MAVHVSFQAVFHQKDACDGLHVAVFNIETFFCFFATSTREGQKVNQVILFNTTKNGEQDGKNKNKLRLGVERPLHKVSFNVMSASSHLSGRLNEAYTCSQIHLEVFKICAFFVNRLALEAHSACYGLGAKSFHSFYLQIFKSVSKRQNIFFFNRLMNEQNEVAGGILKI